TPSKTGNDKHDSAVKAHENVRKYQEMLARGRKDYASIADEVMEIVEKDVSDHVKKDKRNAKLTDDEKRSYANLMTGLASDKDIGLAVVAGLAREAE
ncbi:hypothetical protein LRR18_18070, partial [Mangrovimonas sp. AS39]|uniref:hypothetical protein n=1 Tax=Mangrovimonas futianensis TaxID=2895523 RepID=UPI001E5962B4